MPRWLFLVLITALALSVVGSVLIVLRSPRDASREAARDVPSTMAAPPVAGAPAAPVPQPAGRP